MKQCEICDIIFESSRQYSNHIRWKHKNILYKKSKCSFCAKDFRNENLEKHISVCPKNPSNIRKCLFCNAIISVRYNKFCNSVCSAKYNNAKKDYSIIDRSYITDSWKENISKQIKIYWENGTYKHTNIHRSKNEISIFNYFKTTFPNDLWKAGGRLKLSNGDILSRDMWSDKLKICFEYDGIWHFENICNQLPKKQLKDKLLEEWCIVNNYRLVRIDELKFENVNQIKDLIYNNTLPIIKIGERY